MNVTGPDISIPMSKSRKLSILVPAYNEGPTIHRILDRLRTLDLIEEVEKEIVVVNDCSTDNTEERILAYKADHPEFPLAYFKHDRNQGKGAALHTAIAQATGDYLIVQDADLEYYPEEINELLVPVLNDVADVV